MFRTFKIAVVCIIGFVALAQAEAADAENKLFLDLKNGRVTIELLPLIAPNHVARIKQLVREGFYDGLTFHRVIEGFMAQTGDPGGTGAGGSNYADLKAEFNDAPFQRGTVGAARTADPNSANSQFFICLGDAPHLNGKYTVWGRVVDGMQYADTIKRGALGSGAVVSPDKIVKATLGS